MENLGFKIRELRKSLEMSQSRLAELLDTTQDTVSLWELGKSYPDIHRLRKLAEIFDVTSDYLLGLQEY